MVKQINPITHLDKNDLGVNIERDVRPVVTPAESDNPTEREMELEADLAAAMAEIEELRAAQVPDASVGLE